MMPGLMPGRNRGALPDGERPAQKGGPRRTVGELCVGDLRLALAVSEDAVSYAPKLLRTADLVQFRKEGRVVYYRLSDGFPHRLLEHSLRQLLTIAAPEGN